MPTVEFVEKKIAVVESFAVRFRFSGPSRAKGRDVRSDRADVPTYGYRRAASGSWTVAAWIEGRFAPAFPGYAIDVLDGNSRVVHGKTLLSTVRDSYR